MLPDHFFFYMHTGDLTMTIDVARIIVYTSTYHAHRKEDSLARPDLFLAQGFVA